MTAPQAVSSARVTKPLNWIALLLVVVALIVNVIRMRSGAHVSVGTWALLCALGASLLASRASDRNTRNVLSGVAILLLLAALYGILRGGF